MALATSKVAGLRIDNAAGSLTDISRYVNNVTLDSPHGQLDATGLGDTQVRMVSGLSGPVSVQMNLFSNSTTRAIFSPLVDATSVSKTIEIKLDTGAYLTGEFVPTNVNFGQGVNALQAISATFSNSTAVNFTSVAA